MSPLTDPLSNKNGHNLQPVIPQTPSRSKTSHRLLYRGSLSLPDSKLTLDGLTFSASYSNKLQTPGPSSAGIMQLLENPLALALETMRGRKSLKLEGTVRMKDIWIDDAGGIRVDIHPQAVISQMFFQNTFCLNNTLHDFMNDIKSPLLAVKRSEIGVKVALGDNDGLDGPGTTQIIIYACPSESNALQLSVARIVPPPAHPIQTQTNHTRLPRPDDPTPRKPPAALLKRVLQRSSTISGHVGSGIESISAESGAKANTKKKIKPTTNPPPAENHPATGKRKREEHEEQEGLLERANKNLVKVTTSNHLTSPPINLRKSNQEFKDLYSVIYKGVQFALRDQMKIIPVDPDDVERIVQLHADLYVLPRGKAS